MATSVFLPAHFVSGMRPSSCQGRNHKASVSRNALPISRCFDRGTARGNSWRRQNGISSATPDESMAQGSDFDDDDEVVERELAEDEDVPGTYADAMNPRSRLGKAVSSACDDIDSLAKAERDQLEEAQRVLEKFGFKGSLFTAPAKDDDEEGVDVPEDK